MALITKIRQKAGITVGLVALGLILFLLGDDILRPNSRLLGKNSVYVGSINGVKIKYDEFVNQVEEMKDNFMMNFGRNPNESDMVTIRQQAWDLLIVKYAFQKQFDELGLAVTEEEIVDMVQGNNIHPDIVQAFTNPETGEFNREQIVMYLQNLNQLPPQQQAFWYLFEQNLPPSRLRIKYDNLLQASNFITEEESKKLYESENSVAEIKYLYIPYYTVSDSFDITESKLSEYLTKNEKDFQVEESRDLSYIQFEVIPSSEDSLYILNEMEEIREEFRVTEEDSIFAYANSDGSSPFRIYNISQLPVRLRDNYKSLKKGDLIDPYIQGGNYLMHKVNEVFADSIEYARASHILIQPESQSESDKTKARNEANTLLNKIKNGADFALMALQNSKDPSSTAGGDLGWFSGDRMVEPFSDAVFGATREGLIPRVVETQFGFHLINVTAVKTNKAYKIATIEKEISPSDFTINEAYRKADLFLAEAGNYDEFIRQATVDSLQINSAEELSRSDRRIPALGEAREIIRWAFTNASVGEVSEIFELENNFVIAVLTNIRKAGTADLNDVREEVSLKLLNDLKAEMIIKKLQGLNGTMEEIAAAYGEDANIYSNADLRLSASSLPNVGMAPKTIGTVFSLSEGELSAPIKENDGVVMVQLMAMTKAPEIADYTGYKNQLEQRRSSGTSYMLSELVKKYADISDDRYRFY